MVSRRNFLSVTAVMMIVCFLFQSLNIAREYLNEYEVNTYAQDKEALSGRTDAYTPKDSQNALVVSIQNDENAENDSTFFWALYSKWAYYGCASLSDYERARAEGAIKPPKLIVLDAGCIDWTDEKEIKILEGCVEDGISLVFSTLPAASVIDENEALRRLLGISRVVSQSTHAAGIHLFDGFLLGGEAIYAAKAQEKEKQDLQLSFPWYELTAGTKVYMKGVFEDESVKTEDYPAVIWRKSFDNAYVFAVNGDYMHGAAALGVLSGFVSEMSDYNIYPVVNAQNLVIVNYPGLADENRDKMQSLYSQSMRNVFRDIIWPSVAAVYQENNLGLTCMMSPQFDYSDTLLPRSEDLSYYLKLVRQLHGEVGLSADTVSDTTLSEKLSQDARFMAQALPDYDFASFYRADRTDEAVLEALSEPFLKNVRTVVEPEADTADILGFETETVTRQRMIADGCEHTYMDDFIVKSVESALGYTGVLLDLSRIAYPAEEADTWERVSEQFAANTKTYWNSFSGFDKTTVSESDSRIRTFLSLNYSDERSGDTIRLTKNDADSTAWFILRTHNEAVKSVTGGNAKKLENDVWLIEADETETIITLEAADERYYYE